MAFAYNKSTITHAGESGGGSGQLRLGPRAKKRVSRHTSGPRRDHGGLTATGGGVTPPSGGGVTHAGMRTPGMRGASTTPHKGPGSPTHGGRPRYKSRTRSSFGASTRGYSK